MRPFATVSVVGMAALLTPFIASAAEKPTPLVGDGAASRIIATCTEPDGTVISGYGEPGDMKLSVSRPGVKPVVIALPTKTNNIRSISPGVGNKVILIEAAAADDLSKTNNPDTQDKGAA